MIPSNSPNFFRILISVYLGLKDTSKFRLKYFAKNPHIDLEGRRTGRGMTGEIPMAPL